MEWKLLTPMKPMRRTPAADGIVNPDVLSECSRKPVSDSAKNIIEKSAALDCGRRLLSADPARLTGTSLQSALFHCAPDALAAVNREGQVVEANAAWLALAEEYPWLGRPTGEKDGSAAFIDAAAFGLACGEAAAVLAGIGDVLGGAQAHYAAEFSMIQGGCQRWLRLETQGLAEDIAAMTLRDISLRRKTQQDLRESHTLFQRIMDSTGDGIFIYDTEGRFLLHNAACVSHFSLPSEQVAGKSIEEVFPPYLVPTIRSQNELVLRTGRTLGYELVFKAPMGERTLLVQKGLYRNHRGEAVGIIGIFHDITERKQAELKLERSERYFRALIEKSTDCIIVLSANGTILYASPAIRHIAGYDAGDVIATDAFFWVHPEEIATARQRFAKVTAIPGEGGTAEFRVLCKDGTWKWVEVTASNLLRDPNVQAVVLNVRDVSERREAQQASRRFEAIVESSIDGILSIDPRGRITSWNPAAGRIFGYAEEEMLGRDFSVLVPEDRLEENHGLAEAVLHGKAIRDFETVRLARDGRRVEVSLTFSPIFCRDRKCTGYAAIVRDITDRRRLEKEVLEIADFEKHRIGQDLHDDLCQHLVGIAMIGNLLYTELKRQEAAQAKEARQINEMISKAIEHARNLAKGLSPLNIAQGGLMAGLEMLAANTTQMFRFPCTFECPSAVHVTNLEVATHLYRIAQEALNNAIKHSRGSHIVIRLERSGGAVQISVIDDGIGLSAPRPPSQGGGMGMHTMCYRARIIGAAIEIQSNPGGGTYVVCRLPEPKEEVETRAESQSPSPKKRAKRRAKL